jgi:hypothetical protein
LYGLIPPLNSNQEVRVRWFFVVALFLVGCSSVPETYQRAYVDPMALKGVQVLPKEDKGTEASLLRKVTEGEITLTVKPRQAQDVLKTAERVAFKKKLSKETAAKLTSALLKEMRQETCFEADIRGESETDTNLNYVYLTLELADGKLLPLAAENIQEPKAQTHFGSYSSGGYPMYGYGGRISGYTPTHTNTYSYTTYSNFANFCTKPAVKIEDGFTIYADFRQEEGLHVHDLVWSTNPEDRKTFKYWPGVPWYSNVTGQTKPWLDARYKNSASKIRKTAE